MQITSKHKSQANASFSASIKPLTPKSDQCLISPNSNTAQSNIKVARKKEVISK